MENEDKVEVKMEQNAPQKGSWRLIKKILIWSAGIFIVILGLLVWMGNNIPEIERSLRVWQTEKYEKALQKQKDEAIARYTADVDGGKTPEETLDLFISALKAGDIEKASRYYVLEKQGATLADFKEEVKKYADLHLSIEYFTDVMGKGIKWCNEKKDGCNFEYIYVNKEKKILPVYGRTETIVIPAGEKSTKLISLNLNQFSGVWKIELP
ncbi:MAG: hypothetical protein ABL927_13640 [Bdellovibrionales bacterium]